MNLFCTETIHVFGDLVNFLCVKLQKASRTQCLKMLLFLVLLMDVFSVPYLLIEVKNKLLNVFLDALAWKNIFIFGQFVA